MSNQPTEQSFLKDVADHQMHVLMDNGVYRHIRFKRPNSGFCHFDLITYPGYLVYSGDMGCYVFSRLNDMFQFFRTDRNDFNYNPNGLSINLGYWSEKLQAVDGNRHQAGVMEFSDEKFERRIKECLVEWVRDFRDQTTKEQRRDLWDEVVSEVIECDGDKTEAAYRYHNDDVDFHFTDIWEWNLSEYTYRFVWCCYALAWGIQQYDKAQEVKEAV